MTLHAPLLAFALIAALAFFGVLWSWIGLLLLPIRRALDAQERGDRIETARRLRALDDIEAEYQAMKPVPLRRLPR